MIAHNLPVQTTPFVSRMGELAEIARLLCEPACHLLTLVGPGGIGKTRLAVEAAARIVTSQAGGMTPRPTLPAAASFIDGIYFVPLQPLTAPDSIPYAV